MKVSIVGSGYVGTTLAACLADLGHRVVTIDIDKEVVTQINAGEVPIHEPGLAQLITEHGGNRLTATTEYASLQDTDVTFLALPTPSNPDGSLDTSVIETGARAVASALARAEGTHGIVVKSTVIPGTTEETLVPAMESAADVSRGEDFQVAVNPEFLREGSAVSDFLEPDKLVFGVTTERLRETLWRVYQPLIEQSSPAVIETDLREAEFIKYANNAFLASKISLINELGNIAKEYDVDAYEVADAIGTDHRISPRFLRSGLGWGGNCFPKDVAALMAAARERAYEPELLEATVGVNDRQPRRFLELMDAHIDVAGERVAVLGLAFKPGTDDIRNSRAIDVIDGLRARDAVVRAYDPAAMENMRAVFPEIEYVESPRLVLENAVAALVVTGWEEFADLDEEFDAMQSPIVIDGRRVIERRDGIVYEGLTW